MSTKHRAVIVNGARTAIGSMGGSLSSFTASKLGGITIKAAIERAGIKPSDVQEVILGNVISAGQGQAPARQAALEAGLEKSTICTTVNKVCSSGMKSVIFAAQSIQLGDQSIIVAGGFESMSNVPYYIPKARSGYRYGNGTIEDGILRDGLTDVYNNEHMGWCADQTAKKYGFTREMQDQHAIESYKRAIEATKAGKFKNEIVPISIPSKKGEPTIVAEDEELRNLKEDKIPGLKPAFVPTGTVTAANSSKLSDGACSMVVMSEERARAMGLKPIARILGYGDAEQEPIMFTTSPSLAVPRCLKHAGISQSDVEYFEFNEAFSVVGLVNAQLLGVDPSRLNVFGGAVALGHPIGMSGARIILNLWNVLRDKNASIGVAAICNGGGGASSIAIERLE